MTLSEFRASLAAGEPPPGLAPLLRALWHDATDNVPGSQPGDPVITNGVPTSSISWGTTTGSQSGYDVTITIPDPQTLSVTVDVNGERRQDYSTSDMERPVRELMTYISSVTTLHPGDAGFFYFCRCFAALAGGQPPPASPSARI